MYSKNPTTGEQFAEHQELTAEALEQKLAKAEQAFLAWRTTSLEERSALLIRVAEILRRDARDIGLLATREMGKPIKQAIAEVEKSALVCEYYAKEASAILAKDVVETEAKESYVEFDPIGVILAIMPWNFPFWQVFRFIAPASVAGNVGVLKHASNVQLCAQKIEAVFLEAGFPEGIFQNLAIGSSRVDEVIRDERIVAVTLTGSEGAGSKVAETAGAMLKKSVLELGGSDAFIVLADADVETVAEQAVVARLQNAGQSCIAGKRFIVEESLLEAFTASVKAKFEAYRVGDPENEETQMGPVVNEGSIEELLDQIDRSVKAGAKILTGGVRLQGAGSFLTPTILVDVTPGIPSFDEELFGPVMSIIPAKNADHAVELANTSRFGLGASIWTKDTERAKLLASRIESGSVFINHIVKSDPRLPFGGIKKSGYGRELAGYGLKEFVNTKTVYLA